MASSTATMRRLRQQILREAEGYLDLLLCLGHRWPLPEDKRDRVAERALSTLERLDERSKSRPEALYLKGQALRTMERYGEAVVPLSQAADLAPEDVHIWLALGWCYKRIGRLDLAIESLEEAMDVDDRLPILHYNLACYWSLAGQVEKAVAYLEQAFDLDPNYRDMAATEPDFDPIRDEPDFQAVMTVIV